MSSPGAGSALRRRALGVFLRGLRRYDLLRLRLRSALQPGLRIHPGASSNLAAARFQLAPGAVLEIGAGVVCERLPGDLHFSLAAGARVVVGEGSWLRTEVGPIHIVAFEGARIEIGPGSLLNGCTLSAKGALDLGRRVFVGPGSRVYDADQHDLDDTHAERVEPVRIGDCVWIASDVTILRGVEIGEHSVIGARSLVTGDVPAHTVAFGQPARARGPVGDRSRAR